MKHEFRFPGREIELVQGDVELDLEVSPAEFDSIMSSYYSNDNQPVFRLRVTCGKTSDGGTGEGTFVFDNWRIDP